MVWNGSATLGGNTLKTFCFFLEPKKLYYKLKSSGWGRWVLREMYHIIFGKCTSFKVLLRNLLHLQSVGNIFKNLKKRLWNPRTLSGCVVFSEF